MEELARPAAFRPEAQLVPLRHVTGPQSPSQQLDHRTDILIYIHEKQNKSLIIPFRSTKGKYNLLK